MKNQSHIHNRCANLPILKDSKEFMKNQILCKLHIQRKQTAIRVFLIGLKEKINDKKLFEKMYKDIYKTTRQMDFDEFSRYMYSKEFIDNLMNDIEIHNSQLERKQNEI